MSKYITELNSKEEYSVWKFKAILCTIGFIEGNILFTTLLCVFEDVYLREWFGIILAELNHTLLPLQIWNIYIYIKLRSHRKNIAQNGVENDLSVIDTNQPEGFSNNSSK